MIQVGLVDDPRFELHDQGEGHPESPGRVRAIREALKREGLTAKATAILAREATREELLMVHTPEYVSFAEESCLDAEQTVLGPDVVVCGGSWKAALLAAGSAIEATQWVLGGEGRRAFCNLRPPGHHALPDQAMGFCIFNNIALAAKWALQKGELKRVAILDWDVHHGNGTQEIFWDESAVFYASLHQHPFYPGTGAAKKRANLLSIPMTMMSGDADWLKKFKEEVIPAAQDFKPELVLISCGFDAHQEDPLGGMMISEQGFAEMTRLACSLAGGRVVSMLEGGYNLEAIAASACAHVSALLEP